MANPLLTLNLPAPAKLNLFLHITGRRADGYHLLQTLFVFLDHADSIRLTRLPEAHIERYSTATAIPTEQDLVVKAARLLQQAAGIEAGARIEVTKRLPMGGGLGGGSSDAATVLLGLNALWQCGYSLAALAQLGLRLGADVPVFIHGKAAWAEGIGEQLIPVDVSETYYLVVHPNVFVATAKIFAHPDLTRNCQNITMATFLAGHTQNVFEPVVKKVWPTINEAFNWLSQYAEPHLTGSGACLFAAFESQALATAVLKKLPSAWSGFVAKSKKQSPLHQALCEQIGKTS